MNGYNERRIPYHMCGIPHILYGIRNMFRREEAQIKI
jgi:hypothetical protein